MSNEKKNPLPFPWPVDDIKKTDMHHETILHKITAAGDSYTEYARLAIAQGADILAENNSGWTPFYMALIRGHLGLVKIFIETLGPKYINQAYPTGPYPTSLHVAALHGHREVVQFLIDQGALVNDSSPRGETPLEGALRQSNPAVIKTLLEGGASAKKNEKESGKSMICEILRSFPPNEDSLRTIRYLLRAGADPNGTLHYGKKTSALHMAVDRRFYPAVEELLKAGADPNHETQHSFPPLMIAARQHKAHDFIRLLIDHGANPEGSPSHPGLALCWAVMGNDARTVDLLIEKGAAVNVLCDNYHDTPIGVAAHFGMLDAARALLKNGANINGDDAVAETPLGQAIRARRREMALFLIEKGADIKKRNSLDHTPLDTAVIHIADNDDIIDALLKAGADPFAKDKNGDSPHDRLLRIWHRSEGNIDILRKLEKFERFKKPPAAGNQGAPPKPGA